MSVAFTFNVEFGPTAEALITRAVVALESLAKTENKIMAVLDDLEAEVANQTTVEASVEALLANLATAIQNAGPDQARLQAVLDTIKTNDSKLAAAVAANTPAAPST
jgi:hypothetical protein